jgi:hypothetical protein
MNPQTQYDDLKRQLTEAFAQKAQLQDKINALSMAVQGAELGLAVAAARAKDNSRADLDEGGDATGAPVSER